MRPRENSYDPWPHRNRYYLWFIIPVILIILFSTSDNGFTQGQADVQRVSNPLTTRTTFEFRLGYDDNIFDYSPRDIERFVNNEKPHRFSRIRSYDDLVLSKRLMVELKKRLWNGKITRLRIKPTLNVYVSNPLKNYQSIILSLRQGLPRRISLQVEYLLIPNFYIRDYYDSDVKEYTECSFREHLISLKADRKILRNTNAAIIYKRQNDSYNHYFREYDTQANIFGASMSHKPIKDIRLGVKYLCKDAKARGYDEEGETRISSDDSDTSYRENALEVGLNWDAKRRINVYLSMEVGYEYKHRSYTTEKPVEQDPSHSGRQDDRHTFTGKLQFRISPSLSLRLLYEYGKRDVYSPEKIDIGERKNYTNHITSVGLLWQ